MGLLFDVNDNEKFQYFIAVETVIWLNNYILNGCGVWQRLVFMMQDCSWKISIKCY